jgi:hypothetical protein
MGITLIQKQLDDMENAMLEFTPPMSPFDDPTQEPKVISVVGGGSSFGLLLSVRLADGAVRSVMINPVVAQGLVQLIHFANTERGWWRADGQPGSMPFSEDEQMAMNKAVTDHTPPVPGMTEYQNAFRAVSLFGGSCSIGLLLRLRLDTGDVVSWMMSPVVVAHLFMIIGKCADCADWWDEAGNFNLENLSA